MVLDTLASELIIVACSVLSIAFGSINAFLVMRVPLDDILKSKSVPENDEEAHEGIQGRKDPLLVEHVDESKLALMKEVHEKIKRGAKAFLFKEYIFCFIFTLVFAIIIFLLAEVKDNTFWTFWTTIAFLVGAFTSIASGYIGMMIAVNANVRTTKECAFSL